MNSNQLLPALLALFMIVASAPIVDAHGADDGDHVAAGIYVDGEAGEPARPPVDSSGSSHTHIHTCCPHLETTAFSGAIAPLQIPLRLQTARNQGGLPPGFYRLPLRPPSLTL